MPYKASSGRSYCVAVSGSGAVPGAQGAPTQVTIKFGWARAFIGSSVLVVPAKPIGDVQLVVPRPRLEECRLLERGSRARPIEAPNWKAWFFLAHEKSSRRLCVPTWKLWL